VALGAAGCGAGEPSGDASLTVYASVPLSGPGAARGAAIVAGAREALAEAGGEAGGVEVGLQSLDCGLAGGPAAGGRAQEAAVCAGENARRATGDSTAIAYIGELESAPTRTSLPITNDARLLQVSPTAGATDLLAPFEGSDDVPPETQPSGERTFATLAALDGSPGELGREAMALVLAAIEGADDPLDRESVVESLFALDEPAGSPLAPYSIDELGRARPAG
jgi:hypothetical protein